MENSILPLKKKCPDSFYVPALNPRLLKNRILFQNLPQNLFFGINPIKDPTQYPVQVKKIPLFANPPVPYQAREEAHRIWENYPDVRDNFPKHGIAVFHRFGTACPANGCGNCELNDCFFSEFIHHYWQRPNGD
jgi:hypothetical protein